MLLFTQDPTEEYETFKEYTKEELFQKYCEDNNVPDVVQQYIDELESDAHKLYKIAKEIKNLKDIESILTSDQTLRLAFLENDLVKTLTKNRL